MSKKKSSKKKSNKDRIIILPEDRDTLHMMVRGHEYLFALLDIVNMLRSSIKHEGKDWYEVQDNIFDILNEHNIDVWGEVE